ncbi:MFS transporter [Knoellia locipacati]|uniref:MFS transporter n=1 Tax=Knoellia locipacati TaxID=882824 RepID=UPI00384B0CA1
MPSAPSRPDQRRTAHGARSVPPRPPLPRTVWVLVAARAVNRLGAFTLPFLTVTLVHELEASVVQAGWVLAGFGLATIPSRLVGGRLADRWGARSTIALGLVATAMAQLAVAASHSLVHAVVAVIALGLVFEVYEPASQSLVADVTPPGQRPAAYGLLAAAMAAAGMGAGLLATLLASVDLRWLFVVDALTCLACAVVVLALLPRRGPNIEVASREAPGADAGCDAGPWRDRGLLAMLCAGTVFAAIYLQITIALPLALGARGLDPATLGLLLTVSAATLTAGQPLLRRSGLARDSFAAMTVGYVVLAVGLLLYGLASSPWQFVGATVVWSLGDVLLLGHAYSIVAALAGDGSRGRYLAAYGLSWGFAGVAAPLVGTQLFERFGPTGTWATTAVVALVLAAAQPVLRGRLGPDATARRA